MNLSRITDNVNFMDTPLAGFILIDKPSGPTSHDVVDMVRRATGIRKVGHAGTLDPFASGLLLIAVGKATKAISQFVGLDKEYIATLKFGATSDTMDRTGTITPSEIPCDFDDKDLQAALHAFTGKIMQTPPMYSAKKVKGRKLYELAREGKTIKREPREIMVHGLKLLERTDDIAIMETHVSSGTYIRALADDIGKKLKCGAYLEELRRTAIGRYRIEEALAADALTMKAVVDRLFMPEA